MRHSAEGEAPTANPDANSQTKSFWFVGQTTFSRPTPVCPRKSLVRCNATPRIWKNRSAYHTHAWIAAKAAEIASMVSACDIDVAPGRISNGDSRPTERATTVCHVDFHYRVVHAVVYTGDARDILKRDLQTPPPHSHWINASLEHTESAALALLDQAVSIYRFNARSCA